MDLGAGDFQNTEGRVVGDGEPCFKERASRGTSIYTQSQLSYQKRFRLSKSGRSAVGIAFRWTWVRVTSKTPRAAWSEMATPSRRKRITLRFRNPTCFVSSYIRIYLVIYDSG